MAEDTRALGEPSVELIRPRLTFRDSAGERSVEIAERCTLGAADGVAVRVRDPAVSRLHAELEPRADGLWVHDVGSKNGTFVDGVRVERARVGEGGRLVVGGTTMIVSYTEIREVLPPASAIEGFTVVSPAMRRFSARLLELARTNVTVLVLGETGAGKDVAARALHDRSPRAAHPRVVVDGALPDALVMAELAGDAERESAIERASGGTLVVDEVADLGLPAQAALLRLLDSRTPARLAGKGAPPIDVRFVATTSRDLVALAAAGSFREDLYFRLAAAPLRVPPLRDRREDLAPLVSELAPVLPPSVSRADLLAKLERRAFPGNVRELAQLLDRLTATGAVESRAAAAAPAGAGPVVDLDRPLKEQREAWLTRLEVEYLRGLLARHGGNVTRVAEAAGIDRTYVHRLVKKHGL